MELLLRPPGLCYVLTMGEFFRGISFSLLENTYKHVPGSSGAVHLILRQAGLVLCSSFLVRLRKSWCLLKRRFKSASLPGTQRNRPNSVLTSHSCIVFTLPFPEQTARRRRWIGALCRLFWGASTNTLPVLGKSGSPSSSFFAL